MAVKDYYSILEISPSANAQEIKKAFRQLALQYHPDKTEGNNAARIRFQEIREAYDILSDPVKKEQYLQDRWVQQVYHQPFKKATLPETTLLNLIELKKQSRNWDDFRGGHEQLATQWKNIVDEEAIAQIVILNDPDHNTRVVKLSVEILDRLSWQLQRDCFARILEIPNIDLTLQEKIEATLAQKKQVEKWEKWKIPALIAIVLLLCLGIFFLNK